MTKALKAHSELNSIMDDYRILKDECWEARYKIRKFNSQEVSDLLSREFSNVKRHILAISPSP